VTAYSQGGRKVAEAANTSCGANTGTLFFVVSGFYMSFIINEKYSVLPNGTSRFYLNRFLRLYPTYLAVLVAVVLFQTVTRKNNVFYNPAPDVDGFHRLIYSLLIFLIVGQDYVSGRGDCSLLQ
jgi:peptidoglycan/LPS O-acetylase OafA/YrhL